MRSETLAGGAARYDAPMGEQQSVSPSSPQPAHTVHLARTIARFDVEILDVAEHSCTMNRTRFLLRSAGFEPSAGPDRPLKCSDGGDSE
jgi:hypothetical protein